MKSVGLGMASLAVLLFASGAYGAFIVEPVAGGKANANFTYSDGSATSTSSTSGTAIGLTPSLASAFGGNGTVDIYTFHYTPGVDADNTVIAAGTLIGTAKMVLPGTKDDAVAENQNASGLVGGATGTYKVYITWPLSGNVNTAGSKVTITSDGAPIVYSAVDQNGTGANGPTATGGGGMNQWLLLGTVHLTAGNTYTVEQAANVASFVSQRSAGVMWEMVPEPATLSLLAIGGLFGVIRRRRA